MALTKKQASILGKASWEARKKKNGVKTMKELGYQSVQKAKRGKNGRFLRRKVIHS